MPNWFSFWVLNTESSVDWMLDGDMLGSKMSTFGPKFGWLDWPVQPVGVVPPPPPLPVVKTPNSPSE